MKKLFKISILIYFLFTDFILFAQTGGGPGDEDNNGDTGLEGGDPPAAPINARFWIFVIIGVAYAFAIFKKINKMKNLDDK